MSVYSFNDDTVILVVVTILIALLVQLLVSKSISDVVHRALRRHKFDRPNERKQREATLVHVFYPLSRFLIWVIALIVVLAELGVNLAAMITGAGVIGLIAGLGGQSALKDYIAGIFIILEDQFRVGDVVELSTAISSNKVTGTVEEVTARVTKLRGLDGNLHVVRNGEAGVITNMTNQYSRVNVDLAVGYGADIDEVEEIVNDVGEDMTQDERWRSVIVEPIQFLRVDSFGDSQVNIKALGKVMPGNQWAVAGDFRRRVLAAFELRGVEPPFPQRVVHKLDEGKPSRKHRSKL